MFIQKANLFKSRSILCSNTNHFDWESKSFRHLHFFFPFSFFFVCFLLQNLLHFQLPSLLRYSRFANCRQLPIKLEFQINSKHNLRLSNQTRIKKRSRCECKFDLNHSLLFRWAAPSSGSSSGLLLHMLFPLSLLSTPQKVNIKKVDSLCF